MLLLQATWHTLNYTWVKRKPTMFLYPRGRVILSTPEPIFWAVGRQSAQVSKPRDMDYERSD